MADPDRKKTATNHTNCPRSPHNNRNPPLRALRPLKRIGFLAAGFLLNVALQGLRSAADAASPAPTASGRRHFDALLAHIFQKKINGGDGDGKYDQGDNDGEHDGSGTELMNPLCYPVTAILSHCWRASNCLFLGCLQNSALARRLPRQRRAVTSYAAFFNGLRYRHSNSAAR